MAIKNLLTDYEKHIARALGLTEREMLDAKLKRVEQGDPLVEWPVIEAPAPAQKGK